MNEYKATILIPIFNLLGDRKINFLYIIKRLNEHNIPVLIVEQINDDNNGIEKIIKSLNPNIKYINKYIDDTLIHKSELINLGVNDITTKYIWLLDADVYLKFSDIYEKINDQNVIKPFSNVIRLTKNETNTFIKNNIFKIKKGEYKNATSLFGPLSFIIKKEIFLKYGGMNEEFKGWGWEDLEFSCRISDIYDIDIINITGLHLYHGRSVSNEKVNRKLYNKTINNKENELYKKTKLNNDSPELSVTKNQIITQQKKEQNNTIPYYLKNKSEFISYNKLIELPNEKLDLSDLSIIIPVKIDTDDRYKNLSLILEYINTYYKNYELIVIEHDESKKVEELVKKYTNNYTYKNHPKCFHKTLNFNLGISISNNKFIAAYDVDTILHPLALYYALERLKNNNTKFIYPYNSFMVDVKKYITKNIKFIDNNFINDLPFANHEKSLLLKENFEVLYGSSDYDCTGGVFMFEKSEFFKCGAYNPNIISYGCEDNELEVRVKLLDKKIERLNDFNCYHLEHDRSTNSHYNNFYDSNLNEFKKIKSMNKEELESYINNNYKSFNFDLNNILSITNNENEFSIKMVEENKIDLYDLDIIIPVFIDFNDRIRNLQWVINQLEKFFKNYNVIIIEMQSNKCKYIYHKVGIKYFNYPEKFNKTRAINIGLEKCNKKYVCVWDVDALIHPEGVMDSMEKLRNDEYKIVYPYNGWFIDIDNELRNKLGEELDFSIVPFYDYNNNEYNIKELCPRKSTRNRFGGGGNNGGCVIFDRETLNELGNYNENFFEWGFEDDEIELRFEKMGYDKYNSPKANCFHLVHNRLPEASINGKEYFKHNEKEYKKILMMDKSYLSTYIENDFYENYKNITVYFDNPIKEVVERYIEYNIVDEIIVPKTFNDIKNNKINKTKSISDSINDIVFINKNNLIYSENNLLNVLKIFSNERRVCIIDYNDNPIFIKNNFYNLLHDKQFDNFKIYNENEIINNPKCSIIYTTYSDDIKNTFEYFERFKYWKNSKYEIIVVIHDENILHISYLEYLKSNNIIDKIIYTESNHGHLKGVHLGIKNASSENVFIVNNDIRISKYVLDYCIDRLNDPKVGIIGWHYDIDFEGTLWENDELNYKIRPNHNEEFNESEIKLIKESKWFTGKIFDSIGHKRLLVCNGSFLGTKKYLWNKFGGFDYDRFEHYFSDDMYGYAVLDNGYNIENLPKNCRCSQNQELFLSMSDYKWKNKNIINPNKNIIDPNIFDMKTIEELVLHFIFERFNNPNICIIGNNENNISFNFNKYDINYNIPLDNKPDIVFITEPICNIKWLKDYMKNDSYIISLKQFLNDNEFENINNINIFHKICEREKINQINKNININISRDKEKIIFFTQPRVGYLSLSMALNNSFNFDLEQNIFTDNINKNSIIHAINGNKYSEPLNFINTFFNMKSIESNKKYLGFRFNVWDDPKNIIENYINNDEFKIILLKRETLSKSFLDCSLSIKSNIWHSKQTVDPNLFDEFDVDLKWAHEWLSGAYHIYSNWKTALNFKKIPYLELSYENIYEENNINLLFDHLNINTNEKVFYPMKKLYDESHYEKINNIDKFNDLFGDKFGRILL